MTRKLTDEQVKAIKALNQKGASAFVKIPINEGLAMVVQVVGLVENTNDYWQVFMPANDSPPKNFKTPDEVIAYAEHLLNQRYCWLPQNNSWIMSGKVYNFANNGGNKVLELICIGEDNHWNELEDHWYCVGDGNMQAGYMIFQEFNKGITIPAESPIWDAVKGVR